jgi:hypothetical protein
VRLQEVGERIRQLPVGELEVQQRAVQLLRFDQACRLAQRRRRTRDRF